MYGNMCKYSVANMNQTNQVHSLYWLVSMHYNKLGNQAECSKKDLTLSPVRISPFHDFGDTPASEDFSKSFAKSPLRAYGLITFELVWYPYHQCISQVKPLTISRTP